MKCIKVILSREVANFLDSLPKAATTKIGGIIRRVSLGESNADIFKKLSGSPIWEFRAKHAGIAYRIFAFWDTESETLIFTTHGIVKKTQKTPPREIARAERLMKEYFEKKKKLN